MLGEEAVNLVDKDGLEFSARSFNGSGAASLLRDMSKFVMPNMSDDDNDPYQTACKIQAAINAMNNMTEGESSDDAE